MKYLLLPALLLSIHFSLQAQENVGIGTSSPDPSALLHVSSTTKGVLLPTMTDGQKAGIINPPRGLLIYQTNSIPGFYVNKSAVPASPNWSLVSEGINYWSPMTGNPANIYNSNTGNIGFGTNSPSEKVHIQNGKLFLSRVANTNNDIVFNMPAPQGILGGEGQGIQFQVAGADRGYVNFSTGILGNMLTLSSNSNANLSIGNNGNVSVGGGLGSELLTVFGNALIRNEGSLFLEKTGGNRTVEIKSSESGADGASILLYNNAGLVTIEMDADFGDGDGRVITSELQIRGGSDLAEKFDLIPEDEKNIRPGMLVSIDENLEGQLCITKVAADTKIVGVVSGANGIKTGMLMGQQESIADGK
ncbi:MAG: hypothetical protein EOO13_11185, partial [Chitinophagaceae bacterium]